MKTADEQDLSQPNKHRPAISVVVVAFGEEPDLFRCIDAIFASEIPNLELVIVDNGASPERIAEAGLRQNVHVIGPPLNRGFADGCNTGVNASTGEVVLLLNSDAFVAPGAIAKLAEAATTPGVGIASGAITLDQEPDRLNSAGNPIHFSGLCWAGKFREPLSDLAPTLQDVSTASGAGMAITRHLWDKLGGFDEEFFMYVEDSDLSVRCWQLGLRVVLVPDAVVRHKYHFSRNNRKFYYIERNRLILLLTTLQGKTLLLLAPALITVEAAMVAQSLLGGWIAAKLRGYLWLVKNLDYLRRRRARIQNARTRADRDISFIYCARIEPDNFPLPPGMGLFNAALAQYWNVVKRLL